MPDNDASPAQPAVLVEARDRILLITLNRPEAMNAIDGALSSGLAKAIERLDGDPELSLGVLTGAGRGFCAGMDLKAFVRGEDIGGFGTFMQRGARKPLVAAVEGFALAGGLEMALSCDLIVSARGAKFGIPEAKVGLFAAGGGLARLPGRVGFSRAMEMALTGDPLLAEEAHALGLVARLSEVGAAVDAAMELANKIARNAPLAVAASKALIKATVGLTEDEFWVVQRPLQSSVFTSDDAREGPRAFAEKRPPQWMGH